jgi:hypothetical protein
MWVWLKQLGKPQYLVARLRASALCQRDIPITSAWEAIGWWETRRVPYNLIVGGTGIISCIVVGVVAAGSYFLFDGDFGRPNPPLFAIFAILLYGIAANVCLTGGWLAELIVLKSWPSQAGRFSTLSFCLGLTFFSSTDVDSGDRNRSGWNFRSHTAHLKSRSPKLKR